MESFLQNVYLISIVIQSKIFESPTPSRVMRKWLKLDCNIVLNQIFPLNYHQREATHAQKTLSHWVL